MILLQLKLTKLKLEVPKFDFQRKKEKYDTDKLVNNWQNFARVRLQLKFAFIIRPFRTNKHKMNTETKEQVMH